MRLFIWCNCDIAVAHVCATLHMECMPYPFCVIAMCDSNMYLYGSQSHCVNNFTKSHVKKRSRIQKESHCVNEPLIMRILIIHRVLLLKTNPLIFVLTGDGNFAIVKQCQLRNTPNDYAMKIIDKKKLKGKEHMVENEIEIMKLCNHTNICKLIEEFETKDEIYLIMELVKVNSRIIGRICRSLYDPRPS